MTTSPTAPQVLETYTLLQIAEEAFLNSTKPTDSAKPPTGSAQFELEEATLTNGNLHSSKNDL